MKRSARRVPAKLEFAQTAARLEGWGWLSELAASGARLVSAAELRRDERLLLSFELAGEPFEKLSSRVRWVERDEDGYWDAELSFTDEVARRRLARRLLEVLARG